MKTRFGTIKKISAMGLVSVLLLGELSGAVPAKTVYAAGLEGYAAVSEGYEAAEYDLADAPGEAYINTLDEASADAEVSFPDEAREVYLNDADEDISLNDEGEDISPDGASTSVSGTVNVSTLAENSELVLTGDTTLVVDTDKKLKSISGNYDLTINGDKTLTLARAGKVIDVKNLTSNAPLDIKGGNDAAIYASETVYINNDVRIDAVTGIQANYAIVLNKGKIVLSTGLRSV